MQTLQTLQTLLFTDALLANWQQIERLFAEDADSTGLDTLATIGASLRTETIEIVLDDLLDLTEDTAAAAFLAALIERYSVDSSRLGIERTAPVAVEMAPEMQAEAIRMSQENCAQLRAAIQRPLVDQACATVPVYYATNRAQVDRSSFGGPFPGYSGSLVNELSLGRAVVSIPVDAHRMGKIEMPPWWKRYLGSVDKARYMVFDNVDILSTGAFQQDIESDATKSGTQDVLVFMHGFNVSFDEAVMRAAQMSYDLNFQGVTVLFSWPSLGLPIGYLADGDRAENSGASLASLLTLLADGPWGNLHLMAHSMGNRVLLAGLTDDRAPTLPTGQIVMVAADVYQGRFEASQAKMVRAGQWLTSYVSSTDKALCVSRILHQSGRIGYAGDKPYVSSGMDTVDATSVNTNFLGFGLGHSYFSDKRPMLTDLGYLLRHGLPARQREGLRASRDKTYWTFPK